VGKEERMFMDKRRMSRREFLRLGGAGFAGAVLLGSVGCGGEGESEDAIGWQAIPGYSLQAPDENRVEYIQNAISSWEESSRPPRAALRISRWSTLISSRASTSTCGP
jgi:hypothetical protein